jgi:hypothetical protein
MATSSAALAGAGPGGLASPGGPTSAPPNFYAQAAQGQSDPAAKPDHSEENQKFRSITEKLLSVFSRMEKMRPNGKDISKQVKAMAQTLKDTQSEVFEGADGMEDDLTAAGAGGKGAAGVTGGAGAAAGAAGPTAAAAPPPGTGA